MPTSIEKPRAIIQLTQLAGSAPRPEAPKSLESAFPRATAADFFDQPTVPAANRVQAVLRASGVMEQRIQAQEAAQVLKSSASQLVKQYPALSSVLMTQLEANERAGRFYVQVIDDWGRELPQADPRCRVLQSSLGYRYPSVVVGS